MKAIVYTQYGPPEVLQVAKVQKPVPTAGEILIRICAAAVTATDPIDRKGEPFIARLATGLTGPRNPIPGSSLAGTVEAVGADVARFRPGDRVYGTSGIRLGAHAEYLCLPEDAALAQMPANLSFEEAAGIVDGALTALPFLRDHGRAGPGTRILVNGASGSVGSAAVQLAAHLGAEVTGVCSAANAARVRSLGASRVIDYQTTDFAQTGERYDVIFDAVGKRSFADCREALKDDGVYLTTVPTLAILPQMLWTARFGRRKAVFAATGLRPHAEKVADLHTLRTLIEAGHLQPVMDRRYPLEQVAEAHRYVETGRKVGNVVLSMSEPAAHPATPEMAGKPAAQPLY